MAARECYSSARLIRQLLAYRNFVTPIRYGKVSSYEFKTHSQYVQAPRFFLQVGSWRSCSSASPADHCLTHEQVKELLSGQKGVLMDVREPWELREYGNIPGSINVPLEQVAEALQLSPEAFKEKYGSDMPLQNTRIVFSCLAGVRSKKALDIAISLSYSDAHHYPGGWEEWAKREVIEPAN